MNKKTSQRTANSLPNLAAIRERRGISLKEIEQETKISCRFLRAIEAGNFDELPGGIFNVSYIRQYARKIDFNEEELLAKYRQAIGGPDPLIPSKGNDDDPKPQSPDKPSARLPGLFAMLKGFRA
jgi:cytoskeletal protein RodZ